MSLYNVVGAASLVAGQPEDVSQVLANFQAIQTILNGGIDNTNINAAAAIAATKLSGYPSDSTKFLRGDGTWSVAIRNVTKTIILTGTILYTTPAGSSEIFVECTAAGGGAGGTATVASANGCGSGGGGGAYSASTIQAPAASYTVAVGAAGTGGAAGNNVGLVGGDTSFNSGVVLAKGGVAGVGGTASVTFPIWNGGNVAGGASASGAGDIKLDGGGAPLGCSLSLTSTFAALGGEGAGPYGGRLQQTRSTAGAGATAAVYGGGGQPGLIINGSVAVAGGNGANGLMVIWNFS